MQKEAKVEMAKQFQRDTNEIVQGDTKKENKPNDKSDNRHIKSFTGARNLRQKGSLGQVAHFDENFLIKTIIINRIFFQNASFATFRCTVDKYRPKNLKYA